MISDFTVVVMSMALSTSINLWTHIVLFRRKRGAVPMFGSPQAAHLEQPFLNCGSHGIGFSVLDFVAWHGWYGLASQLLTVLTQDLALPGEIARKTVTFLWFRSVPKMSRRRTDDYIFVFATGSAVVKLIQFVFLLRRCCKTGTRHTRIHHMHTSVHAKGSKGRAVLDRQ